MIQNIYNEMHTRLASSQNEDSAVSDVGLMEALLHADYRKATWLGMFLAFSNMLTGINVVNVYALTIFQNIQKQTGNTQGLTPV